MVFFQFLFVFFLPCHEYCWKYSLFYFVNTSYIYNFQVPMKIILLENRRNIWKISNVCCFLSEPIFHLGHNSVSCHQKKYDRHYILYYCLTICLWLCVLLNIEYYFSCPLGWSHLCRHNCWFGWMMKTPMHLCI